MIAPPDHLIGSPNSEGMADLDPLSDVARAVLLTGAVFANANFTDHWRIMMGAFKREFGMSPFALTRAELRRGPI
jgi:hypothetical protein